jgi:hypothetical protein
MLHGRTPPPAADPLPKPASSRQEFPHVPEQ